MKPVAQLIDSPETGDCFRACVASILEVDPLTLPNISAPEYMERHWLGVMNEALAPHNLSIQYTSNGQCYWEHPFFIWSVPSPRYEGKHHAVVVAYDATREGMSSWYVAWDPSPWRDTDIEHRRECYAKPSEAYFFCVVDPRPLVQR